MFIVKSITQRDRVVEVIQGPRGVVLTVNGVPVLRLDDDCDHIVFVGGVTKEMTGLNDNNGHASTVWVGDKATSLRIRNPDQSNAW